MQLDFVSYKEQLFAILAGEDHERKFLALIDQLSLQGHTKQEIYDLFLEFLKEIQIDPKTKGDEEAYDKLCDFMDGFTVWGKQFKILPNEPDL